MVTVNIVAHYDSTKHKDINQPITWLIGALQDLLVQLDYLDEKGDVSKEIIITNGPLALEAVIEDTRKQ